MSVPTKDQMDQLEAMIDAHGLSEVVLAISVLCGDKAALVRADFPVQPTKALATKVASDWDSAGQCLQDASQRRDIVAVSGGR